MIEIKYVINLHYIMTLSGIYIIFFLLLSNFFYFKKINIGILIGLIIPELDLIVKYFFADSSSHGYIFHSVVFISFLYLLLLIISELNKSKFNSTIINGIFVGALIHIIFDILLSMGRISLFWPLPIPQTEKFYNLNLDNNMLYAIASTQIILYRLAGYIILNKIIFWDNLSSKTYSAIKPISIWIKIQTGILVLLFFMYFLRIDFSITLMDFCILISSLIALYILVIVKDLTIEEKIIG